MGGIFVNYRRGDHADLLMGMVAQLTHHFGEDQVFLDLKSIGPGQPYPEVLQKRLIDAEVVLAVIHDEWFTERDEDGQVKLDRADDWIRRELTLALEHGKTIVPVLLDDMRVPPPAELRTMAVWIQDVFLGQAERVRRQSRSADTARLIRSLEMVVASRWKPEEVRDIEPLRLDGRWFFYVLPVLALVLLAGPGVLVRDDSPAADGEAPPLMPLAMMFTLMSLVATGVVVFVNVVMRKVIHSWERDLHRAPITLYHRAVLPLAVAFVLFIGAMAILGDMPDLGRLFIFAALVVGGAYGAVLMVRSKEQDDSLEVNWPHHILSPPKPPALRRGVARLAKRLRIEWRQPLSRIQRDKAEWMLDELTKATGLLRDEAIASRKHWLVRRHPWYLNGYVLWNSLIVGLVVGSAIPQVRTRADPIGFWAVVLAATVLILLSLAWLTVEVGYRSHRHRYLKVVEDIEHDIRDLENRWRDLTAPPSWQLVDLRARR